MHVSAITMKITVKGASAYAKATVTVVDSVENPVSEAVVSGQWSGLTGDSDSGTTAIDGRITLTSDSINKKNNGTFTFCVTDVSMDGWTYGSAANVETCDSITR